jgi:hypothetical protein
MRWRSFSTFYGEVWHKVRRYELARFWQLEPMSATLILHVTRERLGPPSELRMITSSHEGFPGQLLSSRPCLIFP